ncbi:MAG: dGTPase, partial [bacterium]
MSVWLERRSELHNNPARGFNSTGEDSQFQRDRARIIHSASFRSLQSKTQVLGLGESDFYRTRLTHSLEVAQVGSGICEWLRDQKINAPHTNLIPSFSLIEAVCLAHDIGHSPFGHGGEVAMNTMMRDHGGFEANGQTLRILARLGEYSPSCGLDLTRRTMLGTIKYPAMYSEVCHYQ